jgi:hypothetical protein
MSQKLHDEDAPGKHFEVPEIPKDFELSMDAACIVLDLCDSVGILFDARHVGPNSAVALTALARLYARGVAARPPHVSKTARWRALISILLAAEAGARCCDADGGHGLDELERAFYLATKPEVIDAFLLDLLHEGCGEPVVRNPAGLGGGIAGKVRECQ